MRSLRQYFFRDIKLKNKFIVVNLILVLVPTLLLAMVLYTNLSSIIKSNALESETALVSQTAETLYETVSRLNLTMDNITSNKLLSLATYTDDIVAYIEETGMGVDVIDFFAGVNSMIDGDFITSIKIYLPDNRYTGIDNELIEKYYPGNAIMGLESNITSAYWHGIFDGMPDLQVLLCPTFYLTNYEIDNCGDAAYIRRFTNRSNTNAGEMYIAVYFNSKYIDDMLMHNLTGTGSVYYVLNERNSTVASSDDALAGMYMMRYENIPVIIPDEDAFITGNISGNDVYLGYSDITGTGWRLVSVIPADNINNTGIDVLRKTVYLYVFFLVLALLLASVLSGNIAGRLSKIVARMNTQKAHETPAKIVDETGKDEIGQLVDNYNDMIDRINNLMEEQTIIAEKLKVSEVNALQAQINPHFLYNMLDMINWLSKAGKTEQASNAITTLSTFYKLTLSKKEIYSTIGEELRHVELYVKLQNMRFEDKINLIIDVPDDMYEISIPKLVFQPIVENSILHGIFERESKSGDIVITGWSEGSDAVFSISDTGIGMNEEMLGKILTGEAEGSGSNIGIYNTHQRLQLVYGKGYGLSYKSTYGEGTEVLVTITK